MKANVNGIEFEGTPEEIAKFLEVKYNHGPVIDYDDFLVKHEQKIKKPNDELDICKGCPRQGKGCDPQRCL